ncbi:MAG: DUF1853 family protein [Verrucomicrobia bacterium]|nr:DUF1853 family protein [Verrucomicrobiota bacterium]
MKKVGNLNNDRRLRDLRWVIDSPFLMHSADSGQSGLVAQSGFDAGDISVEEAEIFTGKYSGHRVGYYFESLIHYWLKHVRKVEVLAQGFQVMQEGRTLGELDFVFRDEEGMVNHWEVAAKFYLYCEARKVKGSHYIGPNAQDTFELKREKILGKQLPLSEKVFPEVSVRQAFVKGRIFYHPEAEVPEGLPEGMTPDHLRSIWIRYSELSWLEGVANATAGAYHLIAKPYWLAPECFSVSGSSRFTFRELNERLGAHFSEQKNPVLVSALIQDEEVWRERCRVFVVADDWPEI